MLPSPSPIYSHFSLISQTLHYLTQNIKIYDNLSGYPVDCLTFRATSYQILRFSDTSVQLDVMLQNIEDGQPPGFIANLIEYKQTIVREFTVPVYAVACIGIVQTFIDR